MTNREFYDQLCELLWNGVRPLTPLQREWLDYYISTRQLMSWPEMREFDNAEFEPPAEYC